MTSKHTQIFIVHCYSCNNFGHMDRECKLTSPTKKKATVEVKKQRKGWKKEFVKQKDQRFHKYKIKLYGYFHCCHKFGHKVADCRIERKYQGLKRQRNRRYMSTIPYGNMWRRNLDYKDLEETKIPSINEVSKDDVEHNSAINKNDIHYDGKQGEYVK